MPTAENREGQFRTIFEFAPDAHFLSDYHGNFVDGNQAAESTIGYSRHELIGIHFRQLLLPHELRKAEELLARNAIAQPTGPDEFVLNRKDGSQVPVEICTWPVTIDGRQLVLGIARDIRERRQTAELHKANAQLKAEIAERKKAQLAIEAIVRGTVSEIGGDFFASFAAEMSKSFNVAYILVCQHLDAPLTRVRTLAFWSRDRLVENVEYDLAGGPCAVTASGEMTFYPHGIQQLFPADSDLVDMGADSYCGFPLHDRKGEIIGHLAMLDTRPMATNLCDTSVLQIFVGRAASELERELSVHALQRSEAQLRLITDAMPAFISYLGADRRYRFVNKHYENMFGLKQEEIIGQQVWDILGADAYQAIKPRIDSALSGNHERYEAVVKLKGLGTRTLRTDYVPDIGPDSTVRGYCTLAIDITDRLEAEETSRRHRDELAHVARLATMGEMATGLAHELNQPLSAISLYSDACLSRLMAPYDDSASIKPLLEKLSHQALRAGAIVNRIRKLVKKEQVSLEAIQIDDVFNEVLALLAMELKNQVISVEVQLPESLPELYGDVVQIEQVLLNLVRNAIEAISEGGNDQRQIVLRAADPEEGFVEITVQDTGAGLTSEVMARIFDAFFTTKPQGMGMGLAICRSIVEAHGGLILITPNSEHGVTCHVRLPTHGKKRNGSQR